MSKCDKTKYNNVSGGRIQNSVCCRCLVWRRSQHSPFGLTSAVTCARQTNIRSETALTNLSILTEDSNAQTCYRWRPTTGWLVSYVLTRFAKFDVLQRLLILTVSIVVIVVLRSVVVFFLISLNKSISNRILLQQVIRD